MAVPATRRCSAGLDDEANAAHEQRCAGSAVQGRRQTAGRLGASAARGVAMGSLARMDDRLSWTRYQPGLSGATAPVADEGIGCRRYELEPHILEVVPFAEMTGVVAELGCGVGTDGALIARTADKYVGLDFSPLGLGRAVQLHRANALTGSSFLRCDLRRMPLSDGACDYLYSHGVVHHIRDTGSVWQEAGRVLRPGGRFCFMVYHRQSLNNYYGILTLRRLLILLALLAPGMAKRLAARRREDGQTVDDHVRGLRSRGLSYLRGEEWLSRNTDGPQNTYSRVYSRQELAAELAEAGLQVDRFEVRYLNIRVNPPFGALPPRLINALAKRAGWHLYAFGHKGPSSQAQPPAGSA